MSMMAAWILALAPFGMGDVPLEIQETLEQFARAKPGDRELAFYSLDWSPDLAEAKRRARKERRPIFLIANTNISAGCNFYTGHT